MALQYDTPTSTADFSSAINNNVAISAATAAAITTLLGLDTATSVNVAGWDGVTTPVTTGTPDVLAITVDGVAGDEANLVLPDSVSDAKVILIDSEADVSLTVGQEVSAFARVAAASDLIINGGNGNDTLTVLGGANVTLDGGLGNDALITGSGDDVVTGGEGDDHIETGAGNDTIITGLGHDVILAGAGRDLIQVQGNAADFDISVNGSFLELGTAADANSVTIQGGEFVSFSDGHTLAIVETEAEATALRLFESLLGRDSDNASAELYSGAVTDGTALSTVASYFLGSTEYKNTVNDGFIQDLYSNVLGRGEAGADDAAQTYWLDQLANGKTQGEVAALISTSAEAQANGQSNDAFIDSLYESALGRDADTDATSYWVGALIGGSTRADVASSIFSSAEASHHVNAEFVDALYSNALGRDNVADTDAGKSAWIASLDQGATQADVAIGIVGSPEAQDHITNVVVVHGAV